MRHNKHHASLGVTREHRRAMLSNLAASLITHGRIRTTLTKAKALRPFVERVITKAKKASGNPDKAEALHLRRLALRDVRDETAVTLLFNEKVQEFVKRSGGYTRIYKLGPQRISDAAELALIEFVKADDPGYTKSKGRRPAKGKKVKKDQPAAASSGEGTSASPESKTEPVAGAQADSAPAAGTVAEAPAKPEAGA